MPTIVRTREIAYSHKLKLPYPSKCVELHGHNGRVEVAIRGKINNDTGMVIDFCKIDEIIDRLDHRDLTNFFLANNATAENIARWIYESVVRTLVEEAREDEYIIKQNVSVTFWETNDGKVIYP